MYPLTMEHKSRVTCGTGSGEAEYSYDASGPCVRDIGALHVFRANLEGVDYATLRHIINRLRSFASAHDCELTARLDTPFGLVSVPAHELARPDHEAKAALRDTYFVIITWDAFDASAGLYSASVAVFAEDAERAEVAA